MKKKICVASTLTIFAAILLSSVPALGQGQPPWVIEQANPKVTKNFPPLETFAYTTTVNAVEAGPFYVGDQNLGNFIVGPVDRDQEQALNWSRCNTGNPNYTHCDAMEFVVKDVPSDAPWSVGITLTWPGESFTDPGSKREIKYNNLDIYLGVDETHLYVFEDDYEVTLSSGIISAVASRGIFHPETLNAADLAPTGKRIPQDPPKKLILGGGTTLENVGTINDSPSCPGEVAADQDLQPTLCPKITEEYQFYRYWLLVINRAHTRDIQKLDSRYTTNSGYTIATELEIFKDEEDLASNNKDNFIAFDSDTGLWSGDLAPESTLPRAKEPGADGPAATHGLFALKGLAAKAKSGNNPLVYGIITTVLVALVGSALFFIVRRRRGLSGGSSA